MEKAELEAMITKSAGDAAAAAVTALVKELNLKAPQGGRAPPGGIPTDEEAKAAGGRPLIVLRAKSAEERMIENDPHKGQGILFARVARSAILAAATPGMSPMEAAKSLGYGDLADMMAKAQKDGRARAKAMQESDFDAGGSFVPDEVAADFIDLLVPRTVLGKMGGFNMTMARQSLSIPKITSGTTAEYIGERQAPTLSDVGTGAMQLNVKKLAAATVLSMDLIRDAVAPVDVIIRNRLMYDFGLKMDITGIRSAGSQYRPKGIRYLMSDDNVVTFTGTATDYDDVLANLVDLIGKVEDADVSLDGCGWLMTPRTRRGLIKLRAGTTEHHPFADELNKPNPTLLGYPVGISNQMPNNLGGGTESEIVFGNFRHFIIGQNLGMQVKASDSAAYTQNDGTARSAFSHDEMVVQVIGRHDFELEHDEAFACISNSTIGA